MRSGYNWLSVRSNSYFYFGKIQLLNSHYISCQAVRCHLFKGGSNHRASEPYKITTFHKPRQPLCNLSCLLRPENYTNLWTVNTQCANLLLSRSFSQTITFYRSHKRMNQLKSPSLTLSNQIIIFQPDSPPLTYKQIHLFSNISSTSLHVFSCHSHSEPSTSVTKASQSHPFCLKHFQTTRTHKSLLSFKCKRQVILFESHLI